MRLLLFSSIVLFWTGDPSTKDRAPFVAGFDRFVTSGAFDGKTGGRLLLGELSCTACHAAKANDITPKRGPRLDGVGNRLQREWLVTFLADPQGVKPGTAMPSVLHELPPAKKNKIAEDLAAFLAHQTRPFPILKSDSRTPVAHAFWLKGDRQRGRKLYHQIGCVACHAPDKDYEVVARKPTELEKLLAQLTPDEIKKLDIPLPPRPARSVPHAKLAEKYTSRSLTFFLLEPASIRPSGRMPNFHLTPDEAADITAYLLGKPIEETKPANAVDDALVKQGRQLFQKFNCANCHEVDGIKPALSAMPLAKLNPKARQSCMAEPRGGLPHFALVKLQRDALQHALAHQNGTAPIKSVSPAEGVAFTMLQLNCYACHRRDKRGGVDPKRRAYFETAGHVDIGDEGRLPPSLDGIGAKLKKAWLQKVLTGTVVVRPHMLARMPKFPSAAVAKLPQLFSAADGAKQPSESKVFGATANLTVAGRQLMDSAGCVQCHPLRGESLPGVVGVDLAKLDRRVHPKWFQSFLRDPGKIRPGTRMPTFFVGGKSPLPEILGGDLDRQIAAIWSYLKNIERQPLPEKITKAKLQNFELIPKARPVILRTFMNKVGPLAIAVGFPQKVHFAFDAEAVRVARAWRGRFLDAHGTWFNRLAPPAEPLGTDVVALPAGVPFRFAAGNNAAYKFRGYRLDDKGVPTFLYRAGPLDVEDCLEPAAKQSIKRRLRISRWDQNKTEKLTVWFRANAGKALQRLGRFGYKSDTGLSVILSPNVANSGEIRSIGKQSEWIIPIVIHERKDIEVTYQW